MAPVYGTPHDGATSVEGLGESTAVLSSLPLSGESDLTKTP